MKFKIIGLFASTLLLAGTLTSGGMVKADDYEENDDDEHEYYENERKYRDDDDDDDHDEYEYEYDDDDDAEYEYNYDNFTSPSVSEQSTWNIWTKTIAIQKGQLPFTEAKNVTLKVENENKEQSFYVIPREGEMFIPGKAVAEALGAKVRVYKTSQILEVTDDQTEIIFRANTNVAYHNDVKTPLPAVAFHFNNDIYIPISVITNGLGYSVEWKAESNTFICRSLTGN